MARDSSGMIPLIIMPYDRSRRHVLAKSPCRPDIWANFVPMLPGRTTEYEACWVYHQAIYTGEERYIT
jgi:hypothetical protein